MTHTFFSLGGSLLLPFFSGLSISCTFARRTYSVNDGAAASLNVGNDNVQSTKYEVKKKQQLLRMSIFLSTFAGKTKESDFGTRYFSRIDYTKPARGADFGVSR